MITIPNIDYTSDIKMTDALSGVTKPEMFKIVRKLELFVSKDLDGEELVTRFAEELIKADIEILCTLDKQELKIVEEFVKCSKNTHVVRKMRTKPYLLQKYCLVLTYCDEALLYGSGSELLQSLQGSLVPVPQGWNISDR